MTMKLACLRCKRKKIKCDKAEPVCHQCILAKTDCQYVERRQRPRQVQQRAAVGHLNQRLEWLEKQLNVKTDALSPPDTVSSTTQGTARSSTPVPSPEASSTVADGEESWVYRLATDTRRIFQSQAPPTNTQTPRIDSAMVALNEALDNLGNIRVQSNTAKVDLNLTPAEARACINIFAETLSNMVVPDIFGASMDTKVLLALPDIINSPYVNIDPGLHIMYYNAMYYGLQRLHGSGDRRTQKAYLKILELVPSWLEHSAGSRIDGHAAALTAWTAINNQDSKLSWKFHCKSCQFIKLKGVDELDVVPASTVEEEQERETLRFLYWHILSTDTLFRLFYGKPTVIRWSPGKVKPPSLFRSGNMHPSRAQVSICVVWVRYTLLIAEMINFVDDVDSHTHDDTLSQRIDELCLKLEELIREWSLIELMNADHTSFELRCLLADHIMNIDAIIIGMQRLVKHDEPKHVDPYTLRAARRVVSIILQFRNDAKMMDKTRTIFDQYVDCFITFYPFCAVFSLYEYVLACNEPDDCESDIEALEQLGTAMVEVCTQRPSFVPFARTVNALNKVSRTLQDERRREREATDSAMANQTAARGLNLPQVTFDNFQSLVTSELPEFDPSILSSMPDLPMNFDGNLHPMGFVRALENDFIGRNWHDNWWDLDGGVGGTIAMPGREELQQSHFALPTPNND